MASIRDGQGYELSLTGRQAWHLRASTDTRHWLDELARIMELSRTKGKSSGNVYILRGQYSGHLEDLIAGSDVIPADMPLEGWRHHKSGVEMWYHDQYPDFIINLGPLFVRQHDSENDITEEQHDQSQMSLSLFPFYKYGVDHGGMPFHAGQVSLDGHAILLAAPGGTGKSTCCRRIPEPWRALSDDEALIIQNGDGEYRVHPFPTWSDYLFGRNRRTWDVQSNIPLNAIFILEQSQQDRAMPMKQGVAASFIFRSSMQAYARSLMGMDISEVKVLRNMVFDNACVMAKKIPAFTLKVSLEGQFWEEIEKALPELRH